VASRWELSATRAAVYAAKPSLRPPSAGMTVYSLYIYDRHVFAQLVYAL
jgi:hypothetical protein